MSEITGSILEGAAGASISVAPASMSYGLSIGGQDGSGPFVTFNFDGRAEIHQPDKLNEAAKIFINEITKNWPIERTCRNWVVRKKNVSEFLSVGANGVDWVCEEHLATQFSRQTDGAMAVPRQSGHVEVIPYKDALKFGRARPAN
ncbi:hypothetical protein [Paraburkholderia sp. BCC1886]|uniref:hypothetical protein n=1 Tax=Paraburkholderia sp. BCC1886 TaxID=2562670 RepID=UPI0011842360|nr:hypothetical protein [Paraburkholderia sp. BCC1886]